MFFTGNTAQLITSGIIAFDLVLLLFQGISLLERPDDKKRLWYLLLVFFLLLYNICFAFLPNPAFLEVPATIQVIIIYAVGFSMSMYFPYYFYRAFNLISIKFLATYGSLLFLFGPFLFLFIVPYYFTSDVVLSRKLAVTIPAFYGGAFLFATVRALVARYKEHKAKHTLNEANLLNIVSASIALFCWAATPLVVFFGNHKTLEQAAINVGFFVITIDYIRSSIKKSKREYSVMKEQTQAINTLAYETKTPLMLINNYFLDFKAKYGRHESVEELEIVQENLSRLISGIQNFRRETNSSGYNPVNNISLLLKTKVVLFASIARRKNIEIIDSIVPDVFLQSFPPAMDRVINTQIENAIKFTPENGTIEVSLTTKDTNAIICVSENGVRITVTLQRYIPSQATIETTATDRVVDASRPYIMIVENNGFILNYLVLMLEEKFNLYVATSRVEALERMKQISHLDLIISDIMPDTLDGVEFRKEVAANEKFARTPFILLTDQKSVIDQINAQNKDQNLETIDYIEKPLVMTELHEKIESLIENLTHERETLRKAYSTIRKPISSPTETLPEAPGSSFEQNCRKFSLTPREVQIVQLLNTGKPSKIIADHLYISKKTVDKHITNIFAKVEVTNKVELLNKLYDRSSAETL